MKITKLPIYKGLLCGALLTAALAAGTGTAHAALGVDFNAPTLDYLVSGTNGIAGWSFTATQDLYVTALGIYDHDPDKKLEGTHSVGLWTADGTLVTSVAFTEPTVPHKDLLTKGKYHMINASATLVAGQKYVIAATMGISDPYASFDTASAATHNVQFNQYLTYGGAVYSDSLIGMPGSDVQTAYGNFGANIDVTPTPIPAAVWLMGSGLMGLVGIRRRTEK